MESNSVSRRDFLKSGTKSAGIAAAGAMMTMTNPGRVLGANERVNMAIIGIRSRGMEHAREWTHIPDVQVATICDIDQRLFPERVASIDEWQGKKAPHRVRHEASPRRQEHRRCLHRNL